MKNRQALVSAAMLEAIWSSRKKDLIDLITPFVLYAVAKQTSPGNPINTKAAQKYVQDNFSYPDLPESIIKSVLSRNPLDAFERKDKEFYLKKPLDNEISRMQQRERECNESISLIGRKLSKYLAAHCQKSRFDSEEEAINRLHAFFSRYGLEVGTDSLASVDISPSEYEADYYVAQFIFECKDNESDLYLRIIDLVQGYFLRLAIYIQPENGNIQSASFANTCFILDTPVLIDLLGYTGTERQNNVLSLYNMLRRQKATLCCFPHIKREVIDILTAYKYSLIPGASSDGTKTLEGLNARGYDASDVEREIQLIESLLEGGYGINQIDLPAYATKHDNTVDESQVLGEEEIKQYIKDNTAHYAEDNLENDLSSVIAIHKLRRGGCSRNIESSRFIFVTNNIDFVQAFNKYYKEHVSMEAFQLAITVNYLSAITWIKCGEVEKISETALLKNAYCAMQPIPEIINKLEEVLAKMKDSGGITPEQVVVLRANRVFQNDLWKSSFGDLCAINEYSIAKAQKQYEESLLRREKEEFEKKLKEADLQYDSKLGAMQHEMQQKEETFLRQMRDAAHSHSEYIRQRNNEDRLNAKKQQELVRKKADQAAKEGREKWLKPRLLCLNIFVWLLFLLGVAGLCLSFALSSSLWISLILLIYFIFSVVSLYDTVFSKNAIAVEWIKRKSYIVETKIRKDRLQEYSSVLYSTESTEENEEDSQLISV